MSASVKWRRALPSHSYVSQVMRLPGLNGILATAAARMQDQIVLTATQPSPTSTVLRYHPLLVALHWGLAVFISAALALGALKLAQIPNTSPMKYEGLQAHMLGSIVILILMLSRLLVRYLTKAPAEAATGAAALDVLARISHRAFYALVIAMPVTGLIMAVQTGVIGIVVGAHPAIPADFWAFPIRSLHYFVSRVLMVLIVLHLAGVIYHTFIRKDRLLRRMAFGRRVQL